MNRSDEGLPVGDSAGIGMTEACGTNTDELKLLNFSICGKNLKVAIYGSEADARKMCADHFIYLSNEK